jgi:HEPN domain-containing protein
MVDTGIIKEWLAKAEEDFQFAKINLEEGKNFFPQICFHFQQAAEKYLKAFIIANGIELKKIHDLGLLLKMAAGVDASMEVLRDRCEYLAAFYIESRYPVHWPTNFTRGEATKAFEAALHIQEAIKERLRPFLTKH